MRCIIALVNMSIILTWLGFGADSAEGGGALTRMCSSAPHSRKRPLPTFQKFQDTRPGALTRVSTVYMTHSSKDWSALPQYKKSSRTLIVGRQ